MKSLQRLCAAVALTFVFTFTVFADEGHMSTGAGVAPPPPSRAASATTEGVMDCPIASPSAANESAGMFPETLLSVVEGVLALF